MSEINVDKLHKLEKMSYRLSCLQLANGIKNEPDEMVEAATKFMKFVEGDEDTDSV